VLGEAPKKAAYTKADVYKRYLEGLVWSFDLYGGDIRNYGYHYPYADRIPLQHLCDDAPQLSNTWDVETKATPPLSPIVAGLCLLPGAARQLLPEPFASLDLENDPEMGPIFASDSEVLVEDPEGLSEYLNKVEKFAQDVAAKETLSEAGRHLMSLHQPTAFMDRGNPLLRTFKPSELANFSYSPPKMPLEGGPFEVLADAPHSHRTVAAVNLPRQMQGNWFHFPGPYMQKRKLFTACRRIFGRK